MAAVRIEPTDEVKMPYTTEEEKTGSFVEEVTVAANTAEMLAELGAPLELPKDETDGFKTLLKNAIEKKDRGALKNLPTAYAASEFLKNYGQVLALDVAQIRMAITNKLLEIADCGDTRYELKALELLGKHSDIGLFTERSEITISHKDPESLEEAIKQRIKRLLHAEIIDITPTNLNLDEELDIAPFAKRNNMGGTGHDHGYE